MFSLSRNNLYYEISYLDDFKKVYINSLLKSNGYVLKRPKLTLLKNKYLFLFFTYNSRAN